MSVTPKTLRRRHFCGCPALIRRDRRRPRLAYRGDQPAVPRSVRSARARYERPRPRRPAAATRSDESRRLDPADRVTLDDEIRTALLEVLRRLSPGERVAFVLHDVFGVPFDTIAETVGRPAGTCRQLARRARAKFTRPIPMSPRRGRPGRTSARDREIHHRLRQRRHRGLDGRAGSDGVGGGDGPCRPGRRRRSIMGPTRSPPTCCVTWGRERRWWVVPPANRCCSRSPIAGSSPSRAGRPRPT